ncbi:hypothetical protein ACFV6F_05460 [Kitasatospora phosalacinea]|uniref:hypothetical protein n=1 Tax=Kitasatospora phosalacinea TaxID=2065 RepID=UPI00365BBB88
MEHAGGEAAQPADGPLANGPGPDEARGEGGGAAGELWRAVRHDAVRLPEHLAELAVHQESKPAAKAVAGLAGTGTLAERRAAVITHGIRLTLVEGCVVGGPLILLVPVAFCAGMLAQARMVLELALLAGAEGDRAERSAELLVLQGVYATLPDARAALAATAAEDAAPKAGPPPRPSRVDMIRRMVYLLGLIAIGEEPRGRFRRIAGWVGTALLVAFGLAFPVVWIPVMGRANVRATTALAQRATAFYWPDEAGRPGTAPQPEEKYARTATIAVLGQTLLALLLPVAAFLFVLFLGLDLAGGHLTTALLIALAAGAAYAADRARRARGSRTPGSARRARRARRAHHTRRTRRGDRPDGRGGADGTPG